jgi:ABC-type uncharacterized transport system permease subunit
MGNVSVFCFLASYVVAFALELARLVRRIPIHRTVMLGFAAAGLLAQTIYLWNRSRETSLPPLLSSTHDWMLVLAWLAIALYLVVALLEKDLAVGLFVLPLVLLLIAAAYFVSQQPNTVLAGEWGELRRRAVRGWGMVHATLLVLGTAGVISGLVLSLMYLVQHRRLKGQSRLAGGLVLPSLERLARWNWWSVMISVPLLTLGMLTGVGLGLWAKQSPVEISFADPVVVVNGVAWAAMVGFFVWLWRTKQPAGRHVAWLTLWAFGFLLVTLIGLQVLTGRSGAWDSWHTALPASRPWC